MGNLEKALPWKTKPKLTPKKKKNPLRKKAAIVATEREHQVNSLLNRLQTVRKEKHRIRKEASAKKKKVQEKRDAVTKEQKKKRYIKQGQQEVQRRKAMRLD